jgi:16S rRNA (cytidine1402-2'-O)-methyltransferase
MSAMVPTNSNLSKDNLGTAQEADTAPVSVGGAELSIERPALYVVATPIGNLGDLSGRAAAVLRAVDRIYSEDTRHSKRLLEHYGISTPLIAYHDHNEKRLVEDIVERLQSAKEACALISDAGTPLISDPGFTLVREAALNGIAVLSVPGPCALTAALSISGLATDRFVFEGFLPAQPRAREQRLNAVRRESRTLVYYEAPHRLVKSLAAMCVVFGAQRRAVIARELTKRYESVYRGDLGDLVKLTQDDPNATRGEFVILISGAPALDDDIDIEHILDVVLAATDRKTAVRIVAGISGRGRNEIYRRVIERDALDKAVEKDEEN